MLAFTSGSAIASRPVRTGPTAVTAARLFSTSPPCFRICTSTRTSSTARCAGSIAPWSTKIWPIGRDLSRVQASKAATIAVGSTRFVCSVRRAKRRFRSAFARVMAIVLRLP